MKLTDRFNTTELDILREIINIGYSKAADSLAMMVGQKVMMSPVELEFKQPSIEELGKIINGTKDLMLIHSPLTEGLAGSTVLIFNRPDREKISKMCLGMELSDSEEFIEMETGFFTELANILTGALVTQLSNVLRVNIIGGVPEIERSNIEKVAARLNIMSHPFLYILCELNVGDQLLKPNLLLIFENDSFEKIQESISTFDLSDTYLF